MDDHWADTFNWEPEVLKYVLHVGQGDRVAPKDPADDDTVSIYSHRLHQGEPRKVQSGQKESTKKETSHQKSV